MAIGRNDAALATLTSALARKPANAALRFELAGLLERRGDLAAAAAAYEQALRSDPDNGAALSQLLFARQRIGDWHEMRAFTQPARRRRACSPAQGCESVISPPISTRTQPRS